MIPALKAAGAKTVDRYYSHLASVLHVTRDNARALFDCWSKTHGIEDCASRSRLFRIAPRPLSGRWGRKTQCEDYLLGNDPSTFHEILASVLQTRTSSCQASGLSGFHCVTVTFTATV